MTILKPGRNCSGIYHANTTGLIIDARDYYRLFYDTARKARRYILMTGWQFDTEVSLLRGEDTGRAAGEIKFIHFLEELCENNPELEIYILAWDFSVFFAMEREWFQDIIFEWSTNERINFRFDSNHAFNATHHQKMVIIDDEIAFAGGIDICSSRWDDRDHLFDNQYRRNVDGSNYGSYHDIQSYHTGPIVKEMTDIFLDRWNHSEGTTLSLPATEGYQLSIDIGPLLPVATNLAAISRTQAKSLQPPLNEIFEIRYLFSDAILSAEKLIYIENQYFSSQAVYRALIDRMTAVERSRIQIILILPDRLPFTEELLLGLPQMRMLRSLQQVAEQNGHSIGIYSSVCMKNGERKLTFIHSKLLLVDDRFLTIGSANITNRSMGLDTELNVSWEAESEEQTELIGSIRAIRASLLAEHAGLYGQNQEHNFEQIDNLIPHLENLASYPETRLCHYSPEPTLENSGWHDALEPITSIVDPEEDIFEKISKNAAKAFTKSIRTLNQIIGIIFNTAS